MMNNGVQEGRARTHLGNDQIAVIQRGRIKLHEDIVFTALRHRSITEDEAIEVVLLVQDVPLLLR